MGVDIEKDRSKMDKEPNKKDEHSATFEEAIVATGFGKYNYMLLFIIFFPCAAQLLNTVDLSYVLPVAECDLKLSLEDKGILNGVVFAGMILSGFFWGYFCDTLGRKNIIVYGYFTTGIFAVTAALATDKILLMCAKFLSGLCINGPFTAAASHITEFHSSAYRGKVNMARGIFISIANLVLPLLSWAILPRKLDFFVFNLFEVHSWNLLLLICALTTVCSGFLYLFLPESPKFLMTSGKNKEALMVLQNIYSINSGNPKEDYPIKQLIEETENNSPKKVKLALKQGFEEMGTLFRPPYLTFLILACFNTLSLIMSTNTVKLWLPEIFQAINDYQHDNNGTSNSICIMLKEIKSVNQESSQNCTVNLDNISVYLNTLIIASTRILTFAVSGFFIKLLGVKTLTVLTSFSTGLLLSSIYFARSSAVVTTLSSIGTSLGSVAENVLVVLTLELFPTTLRTTALSLQLTSGRLGTLIGNIIFPYLLNLGCTPPFIFIGLFATACAVVSSFYSSIENKSLQ